LGVVYHILTYKQFNKQAIAIENYEKFLSLWRGADPGIAEV